MARSKPTLLNVLPFGLVLACGPRLPSDEDGGDELASSESAAEDTTSDSGWCDCVDPEICTNTEDSWSCMPPGTEGFGEPCTDGSSCTSGVCAPSVFFKQSDCQSTSCCAALCPCDLTEVCVELGPVEVCKEG